jgi:glycine betaine/choline ABC-type transport system substrate-binding protein
MLSGYCYDVAHSHSRRRFLQVGGTVVGASGLAGCLGNIRGQGGDDEETLEIAVGSWNVMETIIVGYMFYDVINENTQHTVVDQMNYGNNEETWEGFKNRAFHTYLDYTGTMWLTKEPVGEEALDDPQEQYEAVKEQMERAHDLRLLEMADFGNSFALAAPPATLSAADIETLSDLAAYVNAGNYDLQVAMQEDFYTRNDGWFELTDHYGFDEQALQEWESQGGVVQTDIGIEASLVDRGDVDIGLVYMTDAQPEFYNLELIEDDESFWPPYNLVPVVAEEKATETVVAELNKVLRALADATTMQNLNGRVTIDDEPPHEVATSFLQTADVI